MQITNRRFDVFINFKFDSLSILGQDSKTTSVAAMGAHAT